MALTAKQQAFCENYVANGFNATQAAISAGYSEKTANVMGAENLSKPYIAEYITSFKEKASERAIVTVSDVVGWLSKEAKGEGEDTSSSARVSACKTLTDYTGGFDNNKVTSVNVEMSHEEWLDSIE